MEPLIDRRFKITLAKAENSVMIDGASDYGLWSRVALSTHDERETEKTFGSDWRGLMQPELAVLFRN
jgi:hypothetical protein